ncbi:restriction endonuclease [Klebsiella pneumoniae]|uniref:restriction endonuclease n=1 Tax=Klebsiella pneumoniae TaxID=573 RepID=UPI0020D25A26|nr:restriction endonuclease [Klebsiella pneumoniae]
MTMIPFPTTENLILWACSAIALLAVVFFRRSVRHRRHKRKQQSARRVLERIKTLPGFPQKIDYLRKIDPFVFEELLLEGFEAHGFRTTAAWRLQIENRPGSSCCCRTPRRICML